MDLNNANEFLQLLEDKLEEVKIWKSLLEKKEIVKKKKKTSALERVNSDIRELARQRLEVLEGKSENITKPTETIILPHAGEKATTKTLPQKTKQPPSTKPLTHKTRKEVKESDGEYSIQEGNKAKILSTQTLTAVNSMQADKFISGDEVKVLRCFTNIYDSDVAEVLKMTGSGPVKAIIELIDLEQ